MTPEWKATGMQYVPTLNAVELAHGLPPDLLVRVAYQECSFRPEVISGAVRSPAGAVGMFQLMPHFFPGAGASWEPDAATAAAYLASLFRKFGTWPMALGAYNWGPGNIERYLADYPALAMPTETANYIADVTADVSVNV